MIGSYPACHNGFSTSLSWATRTGTEGTAKSGRQTVFDTGDILTTETYAIYKNRATLHIVYPVHSPTEEWVSFSTSLSQSNLMTRRGSRLFSLVL